MAVVNGGRAENTSLLKQHFDYIFFTGSQAVGKEVMRQASEHLTPVTLALGGKSPCIVEKSANIRLAAKRIVFGKFLNCGQTCVAPDYIYCDRQIKDRLLKEINRQIQKQFGKDPLQNPDYGKIINRKHFDRIRGLIQPDKIFCGGASDSHTLQIAPTVLDNVTFADPVMQEEIFGPVACLLPFKDEAEGLRLANDVEYGLASYIWTQDVSKVLRLARGIEAGMVFVNTQNVRDLRQPFGGVKASGTGREGGEYSFEVFAEMKNVCISMGDHPIPKWGV